MKERKSYVGKLNGVSGVWTDIKPEGLEVVEEITFFSADEGKCFKKGDEYFTNVIIKDGVNITDYEEVDEPAPHVEEQEQPKAE